MEKRAWLLLGLLLLGMTGCSTAATPAPLPTAAPPTRPLVTATPIPPPSPPFPSPTVEVPPAPSATPLPATASYTVQAGDTILALALRFEVPIAALQLANDLGESTDLYAGQTLTIPPAESWEGASPYWSLHIVREGETLYGIAADYALPIQRLLEVNHLSGVEPIRVGQPLILPLEGPVALPAPTPTPPPPTAAPTATFPPTAAPTPLPTAPAPPPSPSGWAEELYRLINETRTAHGLPPFAYHPLLAQAAQAHAEDCATRGWGSHVGSDGADLLTRLRRVGYEGDGWAECWAQSLSPQDALDAWMDETPPDDPHRRTILSTWLTEIGIGVAQADWGYFFIADFGR